MEMHFLLENSAASVDHRDQDQAPHKIALSMDHILEEICRFSKPEDLFTFRQLSKQWDFHATKQLQKQLRLHLSEQEDFEELKCLVENRSRLINSDSAFPCDKFRFTNPCKNYKYLGSSFEVSFPKCPSRLSLGESRIQEILNIHGDQLTVLNLDFTHNCELRRNSTKLSEMKFNSEIKSLLLDQAPNLTVLKIKNEFRFKLDTPHTNSNNNGNIKNAYHQKSVTAGEVASFKNGPNLNLAWNTSLKYLILEGTQYRLSVSDSILENILKLAPNLVQIIPANLWDYTHFLQPINILPFLKNIQIPNGNCTGMLDLGSLERIADTCERDNVKFRNFTLHSCKNQFSPHNYPEFPVIRERTVNVINRILKGSWDTLQTIKWTEFTYLRGLKFPPKMPKVVKMSFCHPHSFPKGLEGKCLLPHDCRWSVTFPNVKTVVLYSMPWEVSLMDLINALTAEPVMSVTKVCIFGLQYANAELLSEEHLNRLKVLFPLAQISEDV